jgi:GT2 family glycosyltransferase
VRLEALRGATSIASGCNALVRAAGAAADDVLCFIHQDARLLFDAPAVVRRYLEILPHAGVLGFCGSAAQRPGAPWHRCPPCFGRLLQGDGDGAPLEFLPPPGELAGLRFAEVQTLDGFCLLMRRSVFDAIGGFDESYDGWHGYDLDVCMRALAAGYRNYAIEQPSRHISWGKADQGRDRALARFARLWAGFLSRTPAPPTVAGAPQRRPLRVHVYGLARGDEAAAARFVTSCAGADGVHLLDPGGGPVEALRACGVHVEGGSVEPWRDDLARNRSLELVPADADACVSVDSDETLAPGWRGIVEAAWRLGATRLEHIAADEGWPGSSGPARESRCHNRSTYVWRGEVDATLTPTCGTTDVLAAVDATLLEGPEPPGGDAVAATLSKALRACADGPDRRAPWLELAEACRLAGDHAGGYWAAKRALAVTALPDDGDAARARPHDEAAVAAWYLGLREESRDQAYAAVSTDPSDERLIENYVLILDLMSAGRIAEGPPLIDVVVLAYSKTEREYGMAKRCIRALRASSPDVAFRVVVVETNERLRDEPFTAADEELFGRAVEVVTPGGRFGYNAFLQAGFGACAGSPARYFMVLNNDVVLFSDGFLRELLGGLRSVESVSPFGLREARWGHIDPKVALNIDFDVNRALCGWCLMFDRRILETTPIATLFPSDIVWYEQDVHYGEVLRELGFRHGLVTAARAIHLQSASHRYLGQTLAPPADRVALLHTIPIRHKRCVEVGVARGEFAREILAMQPASLLLVDPWRHQDEAAYGDDPCNVGNPTFDAWHREVEASLGANDRVTIAREPSLAAVERIADGTLDFVYLDANHRERSVADDMRAWWPKVRPGGWLTGHDFQLDSVRRAVTAFCAERGVELAFLTRDELPSWAIQVPS